MDQNKNQNTYQVKISSTKDQVITQNEEGVDFNFIEFIKFHCQLCQQQSEGQFSIINDIPKVLHECQQANKTFYFFYCNIASQLLVGTNKKELSEMSHQNKIAKHNLGNDSGNQSSDQKVQSSQSDIHASFDQSSNNNLQQQYSNISTKNQEGVNNQYNSAQHNTNLNQFNQNQRMNDISQSCVSGNKNLYENCSNNLPQQQNQIDSAYMGSQTAVENKAQTVPELNTIKTIKQKNEKFDDSQQDITQAQLDIAKQSTSLLNPQHQSNQLQQPPQHSIQDFQQLNTQYENKQQTYAPHVSNQSGSQELYQKKQLQQQLQNSQQAQQHQQQQLQSQHQQHSPQQQQQYHHQQQQQQLPYQNQDQNNKEQNYQTQQNLQQQQQQQYQQQQYNSQIAGPQQDTYKNDQHHFQQPDNQNQQQLQQQYQQQQLQEQYQQQYQQQLQQQQLLQQGSHLQNLANPQQPGGHLIASQVGNNFQGQAVQQNIQQEPIKRVYVEGFEYVESQGQPVVQVQCGGCNQNGVCTVLNLSKKEQNQKGENYKRVLCDKCKISIFFIFCECGEVVYSYKNKFQDPIIECSKQCNKINYIKCKGTGEDQKPCENQLQVSIKFPQIKGEFYSEVQCKKCETTNQYFFCKCLEIISNVKGKQKDFQYGRKIICPNAECNWKQYSLVRCPIDNCYQINIFTEGGYYEMGSIIQCLGCQNNFQQVTCPKCSDSLYFEGDYVFGKVIECPCHHKFQQVSCPYPDCYASVYRDIDTENQIQNGQSIICPECQREFYNHLCENCYENITLPSEDIRLKFHQARFYECNNCNNFQQIFECQSGHLNKTQLSKQQYYQSDRDFLSFGERKCENEFCKDQPKLKFFLCPFSECQKVNRVFENQKTDKCTFCEKYLLTMKCKKCKSLNSYFQSQNEIQCITCKEQIKTDNNSEQKTICKICYTAQAEYIMDKCKHLVACSDCQFGLLQMGNGKCPLCRTYGKLEKIYL
ncbi:hypothetical protein PPERSA_09773 [Pseudocohnilembus persalinus]|uniref:RING-type domain-containing protein n=1 Tax=Pseudocohnilembus persalinus TaxID=266149 RepID=A0A0V0QTW2_PSEPJ|nr:hypothetical protein PPERSA_09773 [Pseudocohnilembus persalinus]|eukprot:KRX05633.1 hypothetical protein PPERSA_09773 [Pseudocohnilembus persalinus]